MSRLTREEYDAKTTEDKDDGTETNPVRVYEPPRDRHGFRTDMGGNRKARRAAWAKIRKIRARFQALTKQETAR